MKYKTLLAEARLFLETHPPVYPLITTNAFSSGAKWMHSQLHKLDPGKTKPFPALTNFQFFGILKYGICSLAMLASAFLFYNISLFLIPLGFLVFYFLEIHFLFLFPLLIDRVKNPVWVSIKQAYIIGVVNAFVNTMAISVYMLSGLINRKMPFKNWYVGCMAIVIWYSNEVRSRV